MKNITEAMIRRLARMYPGKKIIRIPEKNPKEVICEIFRASDGSWGAAVAIVAESVPHFHERTCEAYHILKGTVRVMDGTLSGKLLGKKVKNPLSQGFEDIWPGRVHAARAEGRPATVLVVSVPAWTPEDHHLREEIRYRRKNGRMSWF